MITKKYYKLIRVSHADSEYFRITNISNEIGEFNINTQYIDGSLEYSSDGVTWVSYDLSTRPSIQVNPNFNLYLRGTNFKQTLSEDVSIINFTKDYTIGGNYLSIENYLTMQTVDTIGNRSSNFMLSLFYNQTHLISAQNLNFGNVTTIGISGLRDSFKGCTKLTTPPDFSNITSIGSSGLQLCFENCTSFTTGPDLSNVTSLFDSSLRDCFKGCTKLTTGPDLSNVTSVGQNALYECFHNCSKISNVTTPNVSDLTANNILYRWLYSAGGSATGTKVVNVPTGATISTNSNNGIPSGWTRVDY